MKEVLQTFQMLRRKRVNKQIKIRLLSLVFSPCKKLLNL
jgi:hypothetical protein